MNVSLMLNRINPLGIYKRASRIIKSILLSRNIDEGSGRFVIYNHALKVNIKKEKNSKITINGKCKFISWLGGMTPINIFLQENSELIIDGDFEIGHGVMILVSKNAKLYIGGRKLESASGITCDTKVLVNNCIHIGNDFICSWDVFITDSDWHNIDGQKHTKEVYISDHVWVANNCSILKGTQISDGCIVASHSKLCSMAYESDSLIGGVPAKVLKRPVCWKRDM